MGNSGGIVHITVKKSCFCDELEHILSLLVGNFFALVAVVSPELMVWLRSEFVGILGKLLPISYVSECGEAPMPGKSSL